MYAEVITGRFKVEDTPYALPVSACVGLPVLDKAHEALLKRLNAAHRALMAGNQAGARLLLEALRSDMATHFDIEEQIMQALDFSAMRDHVRHHAASAARLEDICRASLARGALLVSDIDLCFQLLIDEILRGDNDLKSHFQAMSSSRSTRQRGA